MVCLRNICINTLRKGDNDDDDDDDNDNNNSCNNNNNNHTTATGVLQATPDLLQLHGLSFVHLSFSDSRFFYRSDCTDALNWGHLLQLIIYSLT